MRTYAFEACHGVATPGNHGKFWVGVPDGAEWNWRSEIYPGRPRLLSATGWGPGHVWFGDLETGEAFMMRPGGSARADLARHKVWVCPLFEHWLTGVYRLLDGRDLRDGLDRVPRVMELPGAPFDLHGYRRPGPVLARGCVPA